MSPNKILGDFSEQAIMVISSLDDVWVLHISFNPS
jgi:hypothetical protein